VVEIFAWLFYIDNLAALELLKRCTITEAHMTQDLKQEIKLEDETMLDPPPPQPEHPMFDYIWVGNRWLAIPRNDAWQNTNS
jgi:hypothetical protein